MPDYVLRPYNYWFIYVAILAADLALGGPFGPVRRYLIHPFRMPSSSMEPTILVGDYFFVSELPSARRAPPRGAIVVFESQTQPGVSVIKRVVALPGDTVAMSKGVLYRNGQAVSEPYVRHVDSIAASKVLPDSLWQIALLVSGGRTDYAPTPNDWGPLVVPDGSLFVLGDNRDNAYDSRFYGPISLRRLEGVPVAIYFSRDRTPGGADSVRWDRIGYRF
jgi:signal peptidase I